MPGAFLKGNSLFPGSSFVVDEISRSWNVHGSVVPTLLSNQQYILENNLVFDYYKFGTVAVLGVHGVIVPSTIPYFGVEGSTDYIYTGSFSFPDKQFTTLKFDIGNVLACSRHEYQTTLDVTDERSEVFYDTSLDSRLGYMSMNGLTQPTVVELKVCSGMLPHHRYNLSGVLYYESF